MNRASGKTEWRVTLTPDPDSDAIVTLENESNGEKGRFEVQCQQKRIVLLGFAKGTEPFTSAGWFSSLRTGMAHLPEEYQTQLLKLCRQESKPQRGVLASSWSIAIAHSFDLKPNPAHSTDEEVQRLFSSSVTEAVHFSQPAN